MNHRRKIFIIIFLIFVNLSLFAQDMRIFPNIVGLREFTVPEVSSRVWYQLNYSRENYYIDNNGYVSISNENRQRIIRFQIENGMLIGNDRGEWGGELTFRNNSEENTIINENIRGIFEYRNELFVIAGLSHLGISFGKIFKLENINNKWESRLVVEFNSSPEVYIIFNNILYIVTYNGLITFDGINIQQILNGQFWSSLYPQSIFVNEQIIAIGMRGCIAIINKSNNGIRSFMR